MKCAFKNIVTVVLSIVLVCGLMPTAAIAEPDGGVGGQRSFRNNQGSTNVYVLAQDISFHIVDQSKNPVDKDLAEGKGIWVQVVNAAGDRPLTVDSAKWFSKKIAQNTVPLSAEEQAASMRAWNDEDAAWFDPDNFCHENADGTGDVFYMRADTKWFDAGGTYQIWAEVRDGKGQTCSNVDDPIIFTASAGYWAGPLEWAADGRPFTWRVQGATYDANGVNNNGSDGKIAKGTSLSAYKMNETDDSWGDAESAAAVDGLDVVQAWVMNVADAPSDLAAFVGTLATTLDLTEALGLPEDAGLDAEELADLSLIWLNPYAEGDEARVVLGAGQGLVIAKDPATGHVLANFVYPEKAAGPSGFMGTFVLARPQASDVKTYTVTISATEGGHVSDTSFTRKEGSQPVFYLFERSGYRIEGVYLADGSTLAPESIGVLEGNKFTFAPLSADISLVAKFEQVPTEERPVEGTTHDLQIALIDPPADTTVSVVGYTGEASSAAPITVRGIDATQAPVLSFNVGGSYVADKVTMTMVDGAGQTLTDAEGNPMVYERWVRGSYLELPLLIANAKVEVTFRLAGGGGQGGNAGTTTTKYAVTATASPAQAAVITADPKVVPKGDMVTFTIEAAEGYILQGAQVTEGGSVVSYDADDIARNVLSIYNVQSAVNAVFSFDLEKRTVTVPPPTQFSHVNSIVPNGSVVVDAEHPALLDVVVESGFELVPGSMWIVDEAGNRVALSWTGQPVEEESGTTYRIPVSFSDVAGLVGTVTFMCEPTAKKHHDTEVKPGEDPDGTKTVTYKPVPDEGYAIDGFTFDGEKIFDQDTLVSDRFQKDGDTYWELDENGERTGNGFRVDLKDYAYELTVFGKQPQVEFLDTPARQIVITVNEGAGTLLADGSVVQGSKTIKHWKTRNGLNLLMTPEKGKVVTSFGLARDDDAEYVEYVKDVQPATADQIQGAKQTVLTAAVRGLTGAEEAYADELKSYIYTLGNKYLDDAKREVRVKVLYGEPSGGNQGGSSGDNQSSSSSGNQGGSNSSGSNSGGNNSGGNSGNTGSTGSSGANGGNGSNSNAGSGSNGGSNTGGAGSGLVNKGDTIGDGSEPNADGTFNIKASVKGGHGAIDGATSRRVQPGSDCTIAFKPETGYRVVALTLDGKRYSFSQRSFTFQDVRAGHTLVVEFGPIPYTGDNSAAAKNVRTLQSLAATGDLNAPVLLSLAALACGAMGIAVLTANRRRKEEHGFGEVEE